MDCAHCSATAPSYVLLRTVAFCAGPVELVTPATFVPSFAFTTFHVLCFYRHLIHTYLRLELPVVRIPVSPPFSQRLLCLHLLLPPPTTTYYRCFALYHTLPLPELRTYTTHIHTTHAHRFSTAVLPLPAATTHSSVATATPTAILTTPTTCRSIH